MYSPVETVKTEQHTRSVKGDDVVSTEILQPTFSEYNIFLYLRHMFCRFNPISFSLELPLPYIIRTLSK